MSALRLWITPFSVYRIANKEGIAKIATSIVDHVHLPWKRALLKLALKVCMQPTKWDEVSELIHEIRRLRDATLKISKYIITKCLAESPPRLKLELICLL